MKLALVCLLITQALSAPSSDMRAATCKCGVTGGSNRIVGGVEAKVNEFPWIASLILIVSLIMIIMMMIMMMIPSD